MTGLSQTAFARIAGTTQQAVSLAVKHRRLVSDAAGQLDPDEARNKNWIKAHWSSSGRPLSTGRNGRRSPANARKRWVAI
jgi:hypothetical protein